MKKFKWLNIKKYNKKQKILISAGLIVIIILLPLIVQQYNKPSNKFKDFDPNNFIIILEADEPKSGQMYLSISSNGKCNFKKKITEVGIVYSIPNSKIKILRDIIINPDFWKTKDKYIGSTSFIFKSSYKISIISNKMVIHEIIVQGFFKNWYTKFKAPPEIIRQLINTIKQIHNMYYFNRGENN